MFTFYIIGTASNTITHHINNIIYFIIFSKLFYYRNSRAGAVRMCLLFYFLIWSITILKQRFVKTLYIYEVNIVIYCYITTTIVVAFTTIVVV